MMFLFRIDRQRLSELYQREVQSFIALHPRSAGHADIAGQHLLCGAPMAWMTRWPGPFPITVAEARGAHVVDVDGIDYIDLCSVIPGR